MAAEPIVKLDDGGKASILSYNVPDRTPYNGRNYIELDFGDPKTIFNQAAFEVAQGGQDTDAATDLNAEEFERFALKNIANLGTLSRMPGTPTLSLHPAPNPAVSPSEIVMRSATLPASPIDALIKDRANFVMQVRSGKRAVIFKTVFGNHDIRFVPKPPKVVTRPHLVLVETYQLSTFLGNYGAGRTISTFSLLPGEKTKISVKTYTKTATEAKSASSILDSVSEESASEFADSLESEQSDKETAENAFSYYVDAKVDASWGWGNAEVKGGIKGSSNSTREEFSKNVSKATSKHAAKASSKRDVQINTSYDVKTESGAETSTERVIENINVSRTLNFVFRQMNQEFITILHLIDVRVAFCNAVAGPGRKYREVALPQLDSLLNEFVIPGANNDNHKKIKEDILNELANIYDYKDQRVEFVEVKERSLKSLEGQDIGNFKTLRVKKDFKQKYDAGIEVPGIIMSVNREVMRTEGVIVEALLGQGEALDSYSKGLQEEAVRAQKIKSNHAEEEIAKLKLANKLISEKNKEGSELFAKVFPCCVSNAGVNLHIEKANDGPA